MNDLMTKSFTSYVDLKKEAMKDLEAGPDPNIEMGHTQMAHNLSAFLEEAEMVKKEMNSIRDILGRLQEANEESKSTHKPESIRTLRNRVFRRRSGVFRRKHEIIQ
ncbi:unnamed protein product [Ilex paraguariensis]|uniref:Syntaxin N-terminal domain-containing protein n=1 Tax=Ilex paraguariensis TaxID=185542 RepID=A0ABC8US67_9AQUA